jgi:ATP-dependent Clp protease ATP-binding subunit ClpC
LGFGPAADGAQDDLRERLMRPLREAFRPEFLNRIDEIVVFQRLEAEQLREITDLLLEETRRRAHAQDVRLEFTSAAVDWLARRGHQPEFGARPLRRTIQREVDNRLSALLLDGTIASGSAVTVDVEGGEGEGDSSGEGGRGGGGGGEQRLVFHTEARV